MAASTGSADQIIKFDSHCHIHLIPNYPIDAHTCYAVNGTQPGDWGDVLTLAQRHPHIVFPSIGLHPWHAHLWDSTVQETLQRMLCDHPHVGVGESGLDKVHARRQANTTLAHEQQLDALHAHMTLAAHYQRPLSLHCVQSYGPLVDMLTHAPTNTTILRSNDMSPHANTAASPPAVVLHSYTGSADTTTRLLHATAHSQHMRVLFSLSGGTLRRLAPEKQRALLGAIPLDHVLLETDADGKGEVVGLQETCRMVAPWIGGGVVEGELMRASVKNATSVFG